MDSVLLINDKYEYENCQVTANYIYYVQIAKTYVDNYHAVVELHFVL